MNRIRNRNTTLDQYYTSPELIKQCVQHIKQNCSPKYVIDTSCGNNLFAKEMNLPYQSYDIDPPEKYYGTIYKTNFLKQISKIVLPEKTLMGFNPPFGWRSALAKQFVYTMLQLKPQYIALILLEPTTTNTWNFPNYKTIFQNDIVCHVPCKFFVLEFQNTNYPVHIKQLLKRKTTRRTTKIPQLIINRHKTIFPLVPCVFIRFTGVNAGLEYYIRYKGHIFHIKFESFKTKKYKIVLENCFKHKVESTTFTKLYYPFKNIKQIKQIVLFLHQKAPSVMNLKSIRYNFNTCDIIMLMNEYFKN